MRSGGERGSSRCRGSEVVMSTYLLIKVVKLCIPVAVAMTVLHFHTARCRWRACVRCVASSRALVTAVPNQERG